MKEKRNLILCKKCKMARHTEKYDMCLVCKEEYELENGIKTICPICALNVFDSTRWPMCWECHDLRKRMASKN